VTAPRPSRWQPVGLAVTPVLGGEAAVSIPRVSACGFRIKAALPDGGCEHHARRQAVGVVGLDQHVRI
jgi:hypothetical protein